jgi:hypothetical protein
MKTSCVWYVGCGIPTYPVDVTFLHPHIKSHWLFERSIIARDELWFKGHY